MFRFEFGFSSPLILSIIVVLFYGGCKVVLATNATYPAIIVFGDSIVDPGNNNYLKTLVKCDFSPYGRDFQGGKATGRFCNGKIPSDFAAEYYGIKELVPPYLDRTLQIQELLTGVSFASGGAGYDPLTSKLVAVLTLSDQLQYFKEYREKIRLQIGEEKTANLISNALFFVCIGSDDIANTYFSTLVRKPKYDIEAYTDLLSNAASQFYQDLYKLGARKVSVMGVPSIGCMPMQRTLGRGLTQGCKNAANQAAEICNKKLSALISSLKTKLPGFNIVFYDSYNPLMSIIQDPAKYGFEEVNRGCCGTGKLEVAILCNKLGNQLTCKDASKFVFWDSYHPTEATYKVLTPMILNQHPAP